MKMSLENVQSGRLVRPIRAVIYGPEGIGKSYFGAHSTRPIFIAAEDGTHHLDVDRFPTPETWADVLDALGVLFTDEHEFETVVVDSVDWCENLAADLVCAEQKVAVLEDIPFGKWKGLLLAKLRELLRAVDALSVARNMNVVLIAHAEIKRFADPETDDYDRYSIKALPAFAALLKEWCDVLAFCNFDKSIDNGGGFGRSKAKSFGRREMHTQHSAAYDAKSRYPIPARLPLDWAAFETAIRNPSQ